MTPILAEAVSWQGAFMAVGIVWGIAFMVWAACKYSAKATTTTTIITEEEEDESPTYKTTNVSIDREEIKRILREMQLEESAKKDAAEHDPINDKP